MKIDTWKQLAWRYRFNDDVGVNIEEENVEYDGMKLTGLPDTVSMLSVKVLAKTCQVIKIDKGNGSFRYVYAPNQLYKEVLQGMNKDLTNRLLVTDTRGMFHAFRPHYSPVTNAKAHIGWKYSAKFDLKSFFDTVTIDMVPFLTTKEISETFIKGAPRQGLPTSPMICSLALLPTVYKLEDELKVKYKIRLTVYADDITISFNNRMDYEDIKSIVYRHIKDAGLKINYKKTKLKFGHKKGMRRIICGVAVGEHDIQRTRDTKRRVRKALINNRIEEYIGLSEWAKCKHPR